VYFEVRRRRYTGLSEERKSPPKSNFQKKILYWFLVTQMIILYDPLTISNTVKTKTCSLDAKMNRYVQKHFH
jgi:hypothetical protein